MTIAGMSVLVRVTATLVLCAVAAYWPEAAARFIDPSFSTSSDYGQGDVQLVGLSPAGESLIDRRPNRRLPIGTYGFDDDYENDEQQFDRSSPIAQYRGSNGSKRSAWAPPEMRVDQLLQKLRSHLYQNRYKHSSPSSLTGARKKRGSLPATPTSEADLDQLRRLFLTTLTGDRRHHRIIDDLQAEVALLELLRAAGRPEFRAEVAVLRSATSQPEAGNGDLDGVLRSIEWSEEDGSENGKDADGAATGVANDKRAAFIGAAEIRSPRDLHPVYLGMGQSAASAALSTYASLLADDKRRENADQHSSNPVRFIGKR